MTSTSGDVTTETEIPPRRPASLLKWSDLDLRNTLPIVLGAILIPLGIAAIILGWNGAANGRVDQQQIPYLISGGILGLAGVIIGCFAYWSHWLYRIYDQSDLHHQEAMGQQAELIRALLEQRAAGTALTSSGASTNGAGFVATPTGTNYHVPGCPMIANRATSLRPVSQLEATEMRPCRVCEPVDASH